MTAGRRHLAANVAIPFQVLSAGQPVYRICLGEARTPLGNVVTGADGSDVRRIIGLIAHSTRRRRLSHVPVNPLLHRVESDSPPRGQMKIPRGVWVSAMFNWLRLAG